MANLVLAVQKQKGKIVKVYGTETVGYFDTDNMCQLFFYLFYYLYLVFTRSVSKVLFVQQEGGDAGAVCKLGPCAAIS